MANKQQHTKRTSGISGRTVGEMYKKAGGKSKPSSERRGLRVKNQLQPVGLSRWKAGFALGGYFSEHPPHVQEALDNTKYGFCSLVETKKQ